MRPISLVFLIYVARRLIRLRANRCFDFRRLIVVSPNYSTSKTILYKACANKGGDKQRRRVNRSSNMNDSTRRVYFYGGQKLNSAASRFGNL
ncbi:MAG: hypothetical protein MSG64_06100 [Pyrinomonadaceae bacterium MAG19_C2-C3]|nr:hypothetical protein [Pyrinomonadaceae bacterium MAG19_C2-C3]